MKMTQCDACATQSIQTYDWCTFKLRHEHIVQELDICPRCARKVIEETFRMKWISKEPPRA